MARYAKDIENIASRLEESDPDLQEIVAELKDIAWLMDCDAISDHERRGM